MVGRHGEEELHRRIGAPRLGFTVVVSGPCTREVRLDCILFRRIEDEGVVLGSSVAPTTNEPIRITRSRRRAHDRVRVDIHVRVSRLPYVHPLPTRVFLYPTQIHTVEYPDDGERACIIFA